MGKELRQAKRDVFKKIISVGLVGLVGLLEESVRGAE
jgi:hypothetical protein